MTEKIECSLLEDGILLNGKQLKLGFKPVQVLSFEGIVIARVEPPQNNPLNRNVLAINGQGKVLWHIAESPHGTQVDKPYTYISVSQNGGLTAGNWNGVDYKVDLRDGSVTTLDFKK